MNNVKFVSSYEWERIRKNTNKITDEQYELIKDFALKNVDKIVCAVDNNGEYLQPQQFVGCYGFGELQLEVLPKAGFGNNDCAARLGFMQMLCKVCGINLPTDFKTSGSLDKEKCGVLEWFIRIYIDEVRKIIKKGLKSSYFNIENNETFLKGKLLFVKNLKVNSALHHKFYVEYDTFGINCPENMIIKATILKLLHVSRLGENKKDLRTLMTYFENVDDIKDINSTFIKCVKDRNSIQYNEALSWSKIYLNNLSVSMFNGEKQTDAFVFDMNKIYEEYVAIVLNETLPDGWKLTIQAENSERYLFDDKKGPKLKPDILIQKVSDGNEEKVNIIMDTKWKKEDNEKSMIKETDLFQMFAYSYRYNTKSTVLIYPDPIDDSIHFHVKMDNINVYCTQFDLTNPKMSAKRIIECFCKVA